MGLGGLNELLAALRSASDVMGPEELDESERDQIELFSSFLGQFIPDIAISICTGQPSEEFCAVLKMEAGAEERRELVGEMSLLGKLLRRVEAGASYLVQDPLGGLLASAPPAARAEALAGFHSEEMLEFGITSPEVQGPAWIVLPLAVYR